MTPEILLNQPCLKSTENNVGWDFSPLKAKAIISKSPIQEDNL